MLDEVPDGWHDILSEGGDWRIWHFVGQHSGDSRWVKQYTGKNPPPLQYSIGSGYQNLDPTIESLWEAVDWLKRRHPWAHLR